jgi:hypothetical protein
MSGDFFVILNSQQGDFAAPLVDEDGDMVMFKSIKEAYFAAEDSLAGHLFGFEVFERGMGC